MNIPENYKPSVRTFALLLTVLLVQVNVLVWALIRSLLPEEDKLAVAAFLVLIIGASTLYNIVVAVLNYRERKTGDK